MSEIVLSPQNKCQIINEDDNLFLEALDKELSYKIQGAEFVEAYKQHRWDGRKKLLTCRHAQPIE